MSKINNWFQIHEVYIDEEDNQPTYGEGSGFGTIDGCGSGKGLFNVAPNKDYDNKYGMGMGNGCGFGSKHGGNDYW